MESALKRVINFKSIFGVVAVTLFISTQLIALVGAAVWALIGHFHLGGAAALVVLAITAVPLTIALVKIALLAYETETDPENN
tara:strand:- start:3983 stop:4231 length:249 start_codon:yes stop_codon:yes gene_type:complete